MTTNEDLKRTELYDLHQLAGAKIVPFAGYEMPVNYPAGIIKEHLHTREKAGLFDVSHMGQISVSGSNAGQLLETLMPIDILSLQPGQQRYALLLNQGGGIIDDLIVTNVAENEYLLVVNAASKSNDFKHISQSLGSQLDIKMHSDKSLVALQGPKSAAVLTRLGIDCSDMLFMSFKRMKIGRFLCNVTRSGYTGEDGFEFSVPNQYVKSFCELLLEDNDVQWTGLGARDSLRLEAGLCLYGHDIDTTTSPIEASLLWAISKSRRSNGERSGGFLGADNILSQIPNNVSRKRVGILPAGRAPVREGATLQDNEGNDVGVITSGGFSPSLEKPICMGYVDQKYIAEHTELFAVVRNKLLAVTVSKLPFVERRYYRGT